MTSPLEKIVKSVERSHKNVLSVAQTKIKVVYQETFEGFPNHSKHVDLGNFYELITHGLLGGTLQNRLLLENGEDIASEDKENIYSLVKPDCINDKKKQIGESKAVKSGESVNLLDAQIDRYKLLQFHKKKAHIYFAIYRHSFQKIMSFEGDNRELFGKLATATYHSIILPFSLILELQKSPKENLVYRYEGEGFYHCTCVKSPTLNRFLTEPEKLIEELGLDKKNFLIKRYLTPRDFSIGGNRIKQFPILRIHDKNHKKWIKNFKFDIKEAQPEVQEEYDSWKSESIFKDYNPQEDGCSDKENIRKEQEIAPTGGDIPF